MKPVGILIVDDHEFIRRGIRAVLEKQVNWQIVGEAANGREAVAMADRFNADVVVMDISMPDMNGLDATRLIVRSRPQTKVLVLSMHDAEPVVRKVLSSGARGYILKSDAGRDLISAIEALVAGKPFFTPKVSELLLSGYLRRTEAPGEIQASGDALTTREMEILRLLGDGRSNKEIATALEISARTVETHRRNLMAKLRLHSIADVVRYALRNQITA